MSINIIEKEIISQLQASVSDLKVEGFPDKPEEYKLLHPKGAVLVHFQGGTYSEPEENIFLQQTVSLDFGLTLLIKGLRDKNGAYSYIDAVIAALTGFTPTGCNKMYLNRVDFLSEDNGLWQYAFSFTAPSENYSV